MKKDKETYIEKLYELEYLVNLPQTEETNRKIEELREELGIAPKEQMIEVVYKGEVVFTGTKEEVCKSCIKSMSNLNKLISQAITDRQGRSFRKKEVGIR